MRISIATFPKNHRFIKNTTKAIYSKIIKTQLF